MEAYLNAAISGNTENLPKPISRIDYLLCDLVESVNKSTENIGKLVTEKIAEIVAGAPADFDTLKEMSDWIYNHEDSAAEMNAAINENKTNIANLQSEIGDIETILTGVVEV